MARANRSKVYRGQSARLLVDQENRNSGQLIATLPLCEGRLTIRLEGPAGCGKSLVKKILAPLLGLLPLDTFVIVERETLE